MWRFFCAILLSGATVLPQAPIPVKVVVVTMFERGEDTGDAPGEFQLWVEREKLTRKLPFPQGFRDLRMNEDGVLAICTGVGTAKAASSIMALGMDPRFDLTKAYWLVAGIAGVDPADATLGSAAWATYVVDGDLAHEIDAREIPPDWKTGFVPLRKAVPYEMPRNENSEGAVFKLEPKLVEWAYQKTKGIDLGDTPALKQRREMMKGFPAAQQPPRVLKGDTLQSSTFWHGSKLNEWANDWVKYHSGGEGNYVTTAMEDTGTLQSLTFLTKAGKADIRRALVLRTASNFDSQRPGLSAAESLQENKAGNYAGFLPSVESAWKVGSAVVRDLVRGWSKYEKELPQ
ncbi:MAG: purine nucleoside permease [Bryobacter sp.]|nr:purine nucleoside permease [Bryobacter sp.]